MGVELKSATMRPNFHPVLRKLLLEHQDSLPVTLSFDKALPYIL